MAELLFERPLSIYIVLGFITLILGVFWITSRNKKLLLAMAILIALGGIVGVVAHLVVTDREIIIATARDIARFVQDKQYDRILPHVDEDFRGRILDRQISKGTIASTAKSKVRQHGVFEIKFSRAEVEINGATAEMDCRTMVSYSKKNTKAPLSWDITWVKRGDRGLIKSLDGPGLGIKL